MDMKTSIDIKKVHLFERNTFWDCWPAIARIRNSELLSEGDKRRLNGFLAGDLGWKVPYKEVLGKVDAEEAAAIVAVNWWKIYRNPRFDTLIRLGYTRHEVRAKDQLALKRTAILLDRVLTAIDSRLERCLEADRRSLSTIKQFSKQAQQVLHFLGDSFEETCFEPHIFPKPFSSPTEKTVEGRPAKEELKRLCCELVAFVRYRSGAPNFPFVATVIQHLTGTEIDADNVRKHCRTVTQKNKEALEWLKARRGSSVRIVARARSSRHSRKARPY